MGTVMNYDLRTEYSKLGHPLIVMFISIQNQRIALLFVVRQISWFRIKSNNHHAERGLIISNVLDFNAHAMHVNYSFLMIKFKINY